MAAVDDWFDSEDDDDLEFVRRHRVRDEDEDGPEYSFRHRDFEPTFRPKRSSSHNQIIGRRGEDAAAMYLERVGFEVIERNWKCRYGEADIIAWDEDTLVFVEVKTRTGTEQGLPEDAVTPAKRRKYEMIAYAYLRDHDVSDCPVRFDVVGLLVIDSDPFFGKALLRHHRNVSGME